LTTNFPSALLRRISFNPGADAVLPNDDGALAMSTTSKFIKDGGNTMPQITLEYSGNLPSLPDVRDLFLEVHTVLMEIAGIDPMNCKSRAYRTETFLLGKGESDDGFVHLEIAFFKGRSPEVKKSIGNAVSDRLKRFFGEIGFPSPIQISTEIRDIEPELYFRALLERPS
jgi:5-carboxymethyl-2-hydroxymuconate isomerase